MEFTIEPGAPCMPEGLAELAAEATAAGISNVSNLISQWRDGSQHFEGDGEALLVAVDDESRVVAVGGLTRCPHVAAALRVRRFFVSERWRRRGIARAMAEELIEHGRPHTSIITCNAAASPAAPPFWESLGFEPADTVGITHCLDL